MINGNTQRSIFSIILPIGLLCCLFICSQWPTINESFDGSWNSAIENKTIGLQNPGSLQNKQKGAHVFGSLDSMNLQPFVQNNFNWITLVPYGDQKNHDSPTINYYRGDSLRMARRDSAWTSQIDLAHSYGFKIFLKPHIWLHDPASG
ncbi:MAG: hypothetical protein ACI9XB_003918, partial [Gammaproteobacteria bacterium]